MEVMGLRDASFPRKIPGCFPMVFLGSSTGDLRNPRFGPERLTWNDVALRSGLHVARTQRLYMAKWYQNRGKRSENHGINDALLS